MRGRMTLPNEPYPPKTKYEKKRVPRFRVSLEAPLRARTDTGKTGTQSMGLHETAIPPCAATSPDSALKVSGFQVSREMCKRTLIGRAIRKGPRVHILEVFSSPLRRLVHRIFPDRRLLNGKATGSIAYFPNRGVDFQGQISAKSAEIMPQNLRIRRAWMSRPTEGMV